MMFEELYAKYPFKLNYEMCWMPTLNWSVRKQNKISIIKHIKYLMKRFGLFSCILKYNNINNYF